MTWLRSVLPAYGSSTWHAIEGAREWHRRNLERAFYGRVLTAKERSELANASRYAK